jgi:hypothetical protein
VEKSHRDTSKKKKGGGNKLLTVFLRDGLLEKREMRCYKHQVDLYLVEDLSKKESALVRSDLIRNVISGWKSWLRSFSDPEVSIKEVNEADVKRLTEIFAFLYDLYPQLKTLEELKRSAAFDLRWKKEKDGQMMNYVSGYLGIGRAFSPELSAITAVLDHPDRTFFEWVKVERDDVVRWILTKIVELLLADERVDPSARGNWSIRHASENGHVLVVRSLLKHSRVDPSARGNWSIQTASMNGHVSVVRSLLKDARVDPSVNDNWAIRIASRNGHTSVVKALLKDSRVDPSATYER